MAWNRNNRSWARRDRKAGADGSYRPSAKDADQDRANGVKNGRLIAVVHPCKPVLFSVRHKEPPARRPHRWRGPLTTQYTDLNNNSCRPGHSYPLFAPG